jgi:cation:H+ antiporter
VKDVDGRVVHARDCGEPGDRPAAGARRDYDVDEVLVGMTALALGTSLPELSSHLVASLGILSGVLDYQVTSAVLIGGNTGSSTVQQFLLVGVLLIGYGTVQLSRAFVYETYLPMLGAISVTMLLAWDGTIKRRPAYG